MGEIQEATQVFVVMIQGMEVAFKLATGIVDFALETVQKLAKFLNAMLSYEKLCGKTNIKKMLKNGDDIVCCKVPQENLKEFRKYAKKYGILYSEVPNGKDGMADILFPVQNVSRVNMLLEKMGLDQVEIKSVMDFVKEMPEEDLEHIMPEEEMEKQKEQSPIEKEGSVSLDKENIGNVSKNLRIHQLVSDPSYEEISIVVKNKEGFPLLMDETEDRIKVRIPYQTKKFIWLNKTEAFISEDRTKITAFLKRDREYVVVDKVNGEVERIQGRELYRKHYDSVERKAQKQRMERNKNQKAEKSKTYR